MTKFLETLNSIIDELPQSTKCSILGDFNTAEKGLLNFMETKGFHFTLKGEISTDYHTLVDLFFSNDIRSQSFLFESSLSDHKPLYFFL